MWPRLGIWSNMACCASKNATIADVTVSNSSPCTKNHQIMSKNSFFLRCRSTDNFLINTECSDSCENEAYTRNSGSLTSGLCKATNEDHLSRSSTMNSLGLRRTHPGLAMKSRRKTPAIVISPWTVVYTTWKSSGMFHFASMLSYWFLKCLGRGKNLNVGSPILVFEASYIHSLQINQLLGKFCSFSPTFPPPPILGFCLVLLSQLVSALAFYTLPKLLTGISSFVLCPTLSLWPRHSRSTLGFRGFLQCGDTQEVLSWQNVSIENR